MFKKITGTFLTRILVSFLNFTIIILTSKLMGAEARGSISLCMLAIAIAGLINEIIGGPAVVYLVPRYTNSSIAKYSYAWAVLISLLSSLLLGVFNFYEFSFFPLVAACSLMLCLGAIHQFILLGHQKINQFNKLALIQSIILFAVFMTFIFLKQYYIQVYFYAILTAYSVAFLLGLKYTSFIWSKEDNKLPQANLNILFNNGILTQLASLTHLLSSRVSFYFSSHFLSLAFVGVLSTAVSVTEAAMLFSSSVALITASTVSNESNKTKAANTTLQLIKLSLMISVAILFALSIFPESLMSNIFGKDFKGIKIIIFTLIPGALANSVSQVISHYYSGLGKFKINMTVGFISLAVSISAGMLYYKSTSVLLPGGIISASAIVAMIYFVRLFLKDNQWPILQLIPSMHDIKLVFKKLKTKS
jgi:O-antigen/teichoic acid export membrane protein